MQIDLKDPRSIGALLISLIAAVGAGSALGLTIEPETTTQMRVENATLRERTVNLEAKVGTLTQRVDMLEQIADGCQRVLAQCKVGP